MNAIKNWTLELSLGEQKLIAFARVFIYKPDIIFLDEATSALDEASEQKIYIALRVYLPNITIVSIGHRHSLYNYHQHRIDFSIP